MATRCNVIVKYDDDKQVIMYHHHDGYPEGVGADLKSRLAAMGEYGDGERLINKMLKDQKDEYEYTAYIAGDAEYIYTVHFEERKITYKKFSFASGKYGKDRILK